MGDLGWDCELKFKVSEKNLGCGKGPATGITWFFNEIEEGIIFEDDCLPSDTLLDFYETLLVKYRNNEKVSLITGTNPLLKWFPNSKSYIFATVGTSTMGAWASWRRSWQMFDFSISLWDNNENKKRLKQIFNNNSCFEYYSKIFEEQFKNQHPDVWDYQWFFARNFNNTVSIITSVNQISNIGFGEESTHTPNANDRQANLPIFNCKMPLDHSKYKIDKLYDWVMFQRFFNPVRKTLLKRILLKSIETMVAKF